MRLPRLLCLSLVLAVSSACTIPQMIDEVRERQVRLDGDIAMFYENVADAYFLVGWEFFELAKEMEKAGKTSESEKYYRKAHIFSTFSKQLHNNAMDDRVQEATLPHPYSELE
jgi:hypothetical protein